MRDEARDEARHNALDGVKALAFDVFGTLVDFRASIVAEGERLNARYGLSVDWGAFADAWRGRYRPNMDRVARGELPWMNLDALHRMALDELLAQFGVTALDEEARRDLNRVWHRLTPWPDTVAALERLHERYILMALSNGNVALLVDLARYACLPFDFLGSAELVRAYKPDPRTYAQTYTLLALRPEEVALVAAHTSDLRAAAREGLRTAFVARPREHGPGGAAETPDPDFDVVAGDLGELADRLGC